LRAFRGLACALFGLLAGCQYRSSTFISAEEDLCDFLVESSDFDSDPRSVSVKCINFNGYEDFRNDLPLLDVTFDALTLAQDACNDACSVWMYRPCEVVDWGDVHAPPPCDIAVDCLVMWEVQNVCTLPDGFREGYHH
jgi:hypothetical protein